MEVRSPGLPAALWPPASPDPTAPHTSGGASAPPPPHPGASPGYGQRHAPPREGVQPDLSATSQGGGRRAFHLGLHAYRHQAPGPRGSPPTHRGLLEARPVQAGPVVAEQLGGRWSSKKPALQKVRGSTRHSPSGVQQTPCRGLLGSPRPGSSLRSHSPSTRLRGPGMMKLLFSWDWGRAERQGFAPLNHLPPVWASVQGMKGPVAPHGLRSPVFSCPAPYRPPGNTGSFGGGGQVLAAGPRATQWAQDGEEGVTGSGDRAVGGGGPQVKGTSVTGRVTARPAQICRPEGGAAPGL